MIHSIIGSSEVMTGVKGGRTPALQHQEQPEEEDRTDNSKAFQK